MTKKNLFGALLLAVVIAGCDQRREVSTDFGDEPAPRVPTGHLVMSVGGCEVYRHDEPNGVSVYVSIRGESRSTCSIAVNRN